MVGRKIGAIPGPGNTNAGNTQRKWTIMRCRFADDWTDSFALPPRKLLPNGLIWISVCGHRGIGCASKTALRFEDAKDDFANRVESGDADHRS